MIPRSLSFTDSCFRSISFFSRCVSSTAVGILAISTVATAAERVRPFQPIEARAVTILRAGPASESGREGGAVEFRRQAWACFERGDWARANDAFLSAIEQDTSDLESAEGLAMSVYRSGDYRAAYRLGRELSAIMPSISRLVAGTVEAEARRLVRAGELAPARELLRHFPATDEVYAKLHQMVSDADALTTGLRQSGGDEEESNAE